MTEAKKTRFDDSSHLLDEEDDATLDLLKQRIKSSDEGHLVSSDEARQRMKNWLSKSSTTKTR